MSGRFPFGVSSPVRLSSHTARRLRCSELKFGWGDSQRLGQSCRRVKTWIRATTALDRRNGRLVNLRSSRKLLLSQASARPCLAHG